ncbi:hypothetical protein BCT27_14475 [Enterovibrio norvegicus]|nr:hypothetical protein BCT27_14475 [Enterovibrio norvegicus]
MATEQYEKHIVMKPSIHLYHAPLSLKALTHATDKVMVFLKCVSLYFLKWMETKQYKKHIVMKPSIHLCHTPLSLKALTHATDKVMVFLECLSLYFLFYHAPLSLKALTHATDKVMVFLKCVSLYFFSLKGRTKLLFTRKIIKLASNNNWFNWCYFGISGEKGQRSFTLG